MENGSIGYGSVMEYGSIEYSSTSFVHKDGPGIKNGEVTIHSVEAGASLIVMLQQVKHYCYNVAGADITTSETLLLQCSSDRIAEMPKEDNGGWLLVLLAHCPWI